MVQFISTKQLYGNIKKISDQVVVGHTFIVLKYSKPHKKIVPYQQNSSKKYTLADSEQFFYTSQDVTEKNLSQNFKQYIY